MRMKRTRQEKIDRIVDRIKSDKKPGQGQVGIEMEHFIVDRASGRRIFYEGQPGVLEILEELAQMPGLEPVRINGHIAGVRNEEMAVSIEPGAQFEVSLTQSPDLKVLEDRARRAYEVLLSVLEKYGYGMMALGVDPDNLALEVPIIAKERYRIMNDWLGAHGPHSRKMMRLSCALQVSIDYFGPEDFRKKYRVLTALVPILYTLTDSVSRIGGEKRDKFNARQEIWRGTDPDRTGLVPTAFDEDFSYASYADWLLDRVILFRVEGGQEVETGDLTLSQAMDRADPEEEWAGLIDQALGIVFPDIRVKGFLEVRPMDALPLDLSLAVTALVKGLFYDPQNLDRLDRKFKTVSIDLVERGMDSGRDNGIHGYYLSDYFANWGIKLLDLAHEGLPEEERAYLAPLRELWSHLETPRTYYEKVEGEEGWDGLREILLAKTKD